MRGTKGHLTTIALSVVLSVFAACGESPETPIAGKVQDASGAFFNFLPGFGGVAIEEFTGEEIGNAYEVLDELASNQVGLSLHWEASNLRDPERWAFVHDAKAAGVEIAAWLLLDYEDGYWANSTNAEQFAAAAREFSRIWIEEQNLPPTAFLIDMEPPWDRFQEFTALLSAPVPDLLALIAWMWEGTDRVQYAQATAIYRQLVLDLKAQGWLVGVSTLLFVVDDYLDGDDGLRQAFNVPIDGIPWDAVGIQLFRTLYNGIVAVGNVTPYFVYDYGRLTKQIFGDKASIGLGITGLGIDTGPLDSETYPNGYELKRDIGAAVAAGYSREQIGVYNLQGMLDKPPLSQWMVGSGPRWYPPDLGTQTIRLVNETLDLFN